MPRYREFSTSVPAADFAATTSFLDIAHALLASDEPLAREFAEMVLVCASDGESGGAPTSAAAELCAVDITPSERTAALALTRAAMYARDANLDDAGVQQLMTFGAVLASRFDSYIAERYAVDG